MAWARFEDTFPEHPKVVAAGPRAAWLFICGVCYANRNLTDGYVPKHVAHREFKGAATAARKLCEVGLWEASDEGGYLIHDYLEYQKSRASVHELTRKVSEARSVAGKLGAEVRWNGAKTNGKSGGLPLAKKWQADSPIPSHTEEQDQTLSSDSASVKAVYDHWRKARGKTRSTYDKIADGRKRKIRARLREFTVDELCAAIDGVAKDTWEDRPLHDDLTVIFRSHEQVEKFLEMGQHVCAHVSPAKRAEAWVRSVGWQYPDTDLFEELSRMGLEGDERKRIAAIAVSLQESH